MWIRAENLTDVDVPLPGGGAAVPGEGESVAHHVRLQDHVVASVGAAEDGGGHAVTRGRELGSLALAPPISVGILTKIKYCNNQNKTKYF